MQLWRLFEVSLCTWEEISSTVFLGVCLLYNPQATATVTKTGNDKNVHRKCNRKMSSLLSDAVWLTDCPASSTHSQRWVLRSKEVAKQFFFFYHIDLHAVTVWTRPPAPCLLSDPTPRSHLKFLSLAAGHQLPRWWHPAASVCVHTGFFSLCSTYSSVLVSSELTVGVADVALKQHQDCSGCLCSC